MASLNSHPQTGYTELHNVTAKDSFLKNPDLMVMTFSHLQVQQFKFVKESRQCLLNAALTCKDFLEVALDELWGKMDSLVPLLKLLPALQFENDAYVLNGNVSQADWDRLQHYSRKVKAFSVKYNSSDPHVHPSTFVRIAQLQSSALFPSLRHLRFYLEDRSISHIFLFLSPLLDSLEFVNISGFEDTVVGPVLATLASQMISRIGLYNGQMTVDILKKSIVHFKHLRSLVLSNAVFMGDSSLWEVLGTLPSLGKLTLQVSAKDPASNPAHAPENPNSPSGGPRYFDALESLCVTGSLFLIHRLLGFIDSPCLKSIKIFPVIDRVRNKDDHEPKDFLTPSMTIAASKWSRSLKNLSIGSSSLANSGITHRNSKFLTLLTDLHEIQTFLLVGLRMENNDDAVRRLASSWPKLRTLEVVNQTFVSLSTLRIFAENCPELRHLRIQLDFSTIPPFDDISSKSLRHNLEVLDLGTPGGVHPSDTITRPMLERQIQVARHLDLIFPHLKTVNVQDVSGNWSGICELVKLCQDLRRGQ